MKVTEHIAKAQGKTLFSFEIVPPKKGNSIEELYKNIEPLLEFKPPFIDVTTSREEFYYKEHSNGLLEKKIVRMRPGTVGICSAIQHKIQCRYSPSCTLWRLYPRGDRRSLSGLFLSWN